MGEFFAMGEYGVYVWLAYGVTLAGMLSLFVWSWFGARSREAELEQVRKWSRAERKSPAPSPPKMEPQDAARLGSAQTAAAGGQGSE